MKELSAVGVDAEMQQPRVVARQRFALFAVATERDGSSTEVEGASVTAYDHLHTRRRIDLLRLVIGVASVAI